MEDPGIAAEPIKLGDDEYFVLGDNRNHSSDSRVASVGVLTRDMLIGRAWVRIYPFNKIGVKSMSKESIKEIDSRLKMAEDAEREQLMKVYAPDDRAGVKSFWKSTESRRKSCLPKKSALRKCVSTKKNMLTMRLSVELTRWEGGHLRVRWLQEP